MWETIDIVTINMQVRRPWGLALAIKFWRPGLFIQVGPVHIKIGYFY